MEYQIMKILRILVPALTMIVGIWAVGWHFWRLVLLLLAIILQGWFMEAFGAYERDVEDYQKMKRKS